MCRRCHHFEMQLNDDNKINVYNVRGAQIGFDEK